MESRYFSLVSDRISSLIQEVEQIRDKSRQEKTDKDKKILDLEIKFLEYRIQYLMKIKDLPFYIVVNELSKEQLREIRSSIGQLGLSLEEVRAYLMEKLNLHPIPSLIQHSELSCLKQIDDYQTIMSLITIQKRNGNYEQQKRDLQRELEIPNELCSPVAYQVFENSGKTRPLCYHEIDYIKKRLATYSAKLEQEMSYFYSDYSTEKIEGISFYLNRLSEEGLPNTFIRTHMKRVESQFPEEKATIKYLLRQKKSLRIFRNVSLKKRRKMEQTFLSCIIATYRNDDILSFFGMEIADLFALSKSELEDVMTKIQKMAQIKRAKIEILDESIRLKQNEILNTARDYNLLQKNAKDNFSRMIYSKVDYFEDVWLHWLWQVPDLLEVFMKGHALAEVETMVECLKDTFSYYKEEELVKQVVYFLDPKKG